MKDLQGLRELNSVPLHFSSVCYPLLYGRPIACFANWKQHDSSSLFADIILLYAFWNWIRTGTLACFIVRLWSMVESEWSTLPVTWIVWVHATPIRQSLCKALSKSFTHSCSLPSMFCSMIICAFLSTIGKRAIQKIQSIASIGKIQSFCNPDGNTIDCYYVTALCKWDRVVGDDS